MQVIGNIGTAVEKVCSKNGKEYFRFRLAENHNTKAKGAVVATSSATSELQKSDATWYYVNAFIDESAADLLAKGTFVSVTGRLDATAYLTKEGVPAVRLTVMAGKVEPVLRKVLVPSNTDSSYANEEY